MENQLPTYNFSCIACDIDIERYFTFNEEHRIECEQCGNPMVKVITAPPTHFKGGGWGGS
jgi:putative FmdB family regulatory protein